MNKNNSKIIWKNYNGKKKLFTVLPKSESNIIQHRNWDPFSSKLGAALFNGLEIFPFKYNSKIFYFGKISVSTLDHLLDIIQPDGMIYLQEGSNIDNKNLKNIVIVDNKKDDSSSCSDSKNLFDVIYSDNISGEDLQKQILNHEVYLKNLGFLIITLNKIEKINDRTFRDQINNIRMNFNSSLTLIQEINLASFFKNSMMIIIQKIE